MIHINGAGFCDDQIPVLSTIGRGPKGDGSGSGDGSYSTLENKPKINGVTLDGDMSLSDIGVPSDSDAIKSISKRGSSFVGTRADNTIFTVASASDIVSAIGNMTVNRAASDASGNNIANTYAKKTDVKRNHTYINVLDYGAKGDGVTDDTAAFQAAFNAAKAGSHIVIPFGGGEAYKITSYIRLNHDFVTVRGEGAPNLSWEGCGIKFVPSSDVAVCFRVYGSGCTFENITISTDNSSHAHMGIGIYSRLNDLPDTDIEVINCKFISLKHGVYHWNRGCLVKDSSFAICDHAVSIAADDNITSSDLQRAIRIEGNRFHVCSIGVWVDSNASPYYMVVNDNYIDYPWGSSTDRESNCLLYALCDFNGLTICNNTVADPRLHAIYIPGTVMKFIMTGNNIFSYNQNSSNTIRIGMVDNFVISSNNIIGAYDYAIYLDTAQSGCISGNFILSRINTSGYGCILVSTKIFRVTISNNSLTLWNVSGGYAVRYAGTEDLTYFVMQGNVCNGNMFQNVNSVNLLHDSIQPTL